MSKILLEVRCSQSTQEMYKRNYASVHLFANEANIGEDTRSPTMNAEDRTPS